MSTKKFQNILKLKQLVEYLKNLSLSIWSVLKASAKLPKKVFLVFRKATWQYKLSTILILIYLAGGIILSIAIYGFNKEPATKLVKIYPLPAVMVNYRPIWVKDFWRQKEYVKNYIAKSGQEMPSSSYILDQMIDLRLVKIEAVKHHISLSQDELNKIYDQKAQEVGGKEALNNVLKEYYGMTETEFKNLMSDNLLREKLSKELTVQVKARHILIKDEGLAKQVLERVKKGEVFEDLAKQYSEDVVSRDNGGDLGWFGRGTMVEDFEEAVFSIEKGAVTPELVKSEFGFHIIRVDDRKGEIDQTFDQWFKELKEKSRIWRLV